MLVDHKAVLFLDLLGFSALTERYPVDSDDFAAVDRPSDDMFLRAIIEGDLGNNKLIDHYTKFNMAVDKAIHWQLLAGAADSGNLTAITFSDSAFIAVDSLYSAICLGESILGELLKDQIPVRCGIAYGSFVVLRFRSDLSLTAGTHAAQFVGTGVVWAHAAAELSGIKGMRMLIHRSAAEVMNDPEHRAPAPALAHRLMDLPPEQRENRAQVVLEVNHLGPNPRHQRHDQAKWDAVQAMKADAPASAWPHYEATSAAFNRMRLAYGHSPLTSGNDVSIQAT